MIRHNNVRLSKRRRQNEVAVLTDEEVETIEKPAAGHSTARTRFSPGTAADQLGVIVIDNLPIRRYQTGDG